MKKKHIYRATAIESVRVAEVLPLVAAGCILGVDVAKEKFLVALATWTGEPAKLLRFMHPKQTRLFLELVTTLSQALGTGKVKVAMEPTGTYGDAVRHQLNQRGLVVEMIQPKKTHDSQEIFDGVPSLHDGKSAVLLARLCALGVGKPWKGREDRRARLRALVEERAHEQKREEACLGRLEAQLARHWPEYGEHLSPRQTSGIALLEQFPSPAKVAAKVEEAQEVLLAASRRQLSAAKVEGSTKGAQESLGVPMLPEEEQFVQRLATEVSEARRVQSELEEQMLVIAAGDEVFARLRSWMGTVTGAVVVALCDPMQYAHADEFVKACGLNLRVKDSGEHEGQLKLTKRGPSLVRQMLYMFTLRTLEGSAEVKAWYQAHIKDEKQKLKAVIAVMRKLAAATFHVARGQVFDSAKLFDLKRRPVAKGLQEPRQAVKPELPAPPLVTPAGGAAPPRRASGHAELPPPLDAPAEAKSAQDLPWTKYLKGGEATT